MTILAPPTTPLTTVLALIGMFCGPISPPKGPLDLNPTYPAKITSYSGGVARPLTPPMGEDGTLEPDKASCWKEMVLCVERKQASGQKPEAAFKACLLERS